MLVYQRVPKKIKTPSIHLIYQVSTYQAGEVSSGPFFGRKVRRRSYESAKFIEIYRGPMG